MTAHRTPRTRCPRCGLPAVLVSARSVGHSFVPELDAWLSTTERKTSCPCASPGHVHVAVRVELYRGETTKRTVAHDRPPGRRR